ncbi:MAG TPA: TonB family protein [Pyrinomonadaceae bacterium]|nr:TonB family protein [Pyrinomonadaceae bacterium]
MRPDFAAARAGLSYVLFATNKHDEATAEAVRAEQGDLDADAHFLLARVRLLFGDPPGALKHLDASVKLAPDFAPAHLLRSQTLVRWRTQSPGRPSGPPDKETALALQRAAAERMAEAAASLETYLRLNPRGPDADLWRGQLESLRHYAQLAREAEGRELFGGREVTKKAVITFKPEPEFTPEARERGVSGVVRLRLTLAADGTVKHVLVLEGLPHGLTEKAVSAARKIKFVPAEFGGRPVSTPVVVEYTFHVY